MGITKMPFYQKVFGSVLASSACIYLAGNRVTRCTRRLLASEENTFYLNGIGKPEEYTVEDEREEDSIFYINDFDQCRIRMDHVQFSLLQVTTLEQVTEELKRTRQPSTHKVRRQQQADKIRAFEEAMTEKYNLAKEQERIQNEQNRRITRGMDAMDVNAYGWLDTDYKDCTVQTQNIEQKLKNIDKRLKRYTPRIGFTKYEMLQKVDGLEVRLYHSLREYTNGYVGARKDYITVFADLPSDPEFAAKVGEGLKTFFKAILKKLHVRGSEIPVDMWHAPTSS